MDRKKTNIKERILQLAKNQNISYETFFKELGISYSNFKGKQKNSSLQSDAIDKILSKYPDTDLHWLITGEVENRQQVVNEDAESYSVSKKGIPYYDVEFESGFDFLENSQDVLPSSFINHPFFSSSEFVVRNSGQSMAKVIKHGDAIGMIHLKHWQEFLAFGEIYALVLKDNRRLIKVITKGDTPDTFTLVSKPMDNKKEEFPPQQINKSFITNVFKVEAYSGKF